MLKFLKTEIQAKELSLSFTASNQQIETRSVRIEKSALILGKKGPDCVHPGVESSIQNVVLRVSRRKKLQNFSLRSVFFVFLTKSLSNCPNSTKPPLP